MVDRELTAMARHQLTRMARQGIDVQKAFDIVKFRLENRDLAVKRVKGTLILDVIADKEKIEVSDAEVNAAMAAMARSAGKKLEEVKQYYVSQEGGTDNLRASLVEEKTLALLLSKAKKV
jgi:trigger factor